MSVRRTTFIGLGLVVFAGALWVHWPSLQGGFLRVDDVEYLQQSKRWNGLTWNAVKWAFTTTESYYQPLPRLSHVLDYTMWGSNPVGHHATNVVLHALNAVLVFGFLWTLLGGTSLTARERLTAAWAVAVVFAIHPLQTESVAWMSGRTQLLCTAFEIGSLWAYVTGARRWAWGLYAVALLCKPIAVALPFVMLAIDYFPLRRHEQFGWSRLVWEKAGLIAVTVAAGVAMMIKTTREGAMLPLAMPLSVRVLRMFDSLAFYLWKLVWPTHLSPSYPVRWDPSLDEATVLASVLSVVIITAVIVRDRRRMPMLAAAWGAYVMLVAPFSGLIPPGSPALASRYVYIAVLPPLLVAGGAVVWLLRRSTRVMGVTLVCLLVGQLWILGARTRRLIPNWHNDETLWRASLVEFPDSEQFNRALATELLDQGRASEALPYAERAVKIAPELGETRMRLGLVLAMLGRPQEAIEQHEQALRINPNSAVTRFGLAVALDQIGKPEYAVGQYEEALRLNPNLEGAHYNLANALMELGRLPEAVEHYQQALQIDPDYAEAHNNLGLALVQVGRAQEAIGHYQQAVRIKPDSIEAHNNLGLALVRLGRAQEAIEHYQQALRIKSDSAEVHNNLGLALVQVGRAQEAIEHCQQALRIKPDFAAAQYNLRSALEETGKLQEAIIH
jgi:tetratricopeptide (TPR) repeat protein